LRQIGFVEKPLTHMFPKLGTGSFFPDDVIERYQRVDRALVAAVDEMYAMGTSRGRCSG
jgi:transposase-like protein